MLLDVLNKKLNRGWIIPLLVQVCFKLPRVVKMLFNFILNSVIWSLQSEILSEHDVRRAE